jgi:hypothetical protein
LTVTKLALGYRALIIIALSASALGCATSGGGDVPGGPEACVIVDNSDGGGTESRIFLVSSMGGWRLGMGEVAMGRKLEYCTQRLTSGERVRIIIERPSTGGRASVSTQRGQVRSSPEFVLRPDDVWTWNPSLNQLYRAIVVR